MMYNIDEQSSDEDDTFSSGISPRGSAAERRNPVDLREAQSAFQHYGKKYGMAQGLRRVGRSPYAYGIVDDLPSRLAFEQLNTLSGLTAKMQQALTHNKRAFQQRVAETYKMTLRQAFLAWTQARQETVIKEKKVQQAKARLNRSKMTRVIYKWKEIAGLTDPTIKMKNKANILLARGLKRRVFIEWFSYIQEETHRDEKRRREAEFKSLQHKRRGAYTRMVKAFHKKRLLKIIFQWNRWSHHAFLKRYKLESALIFHRRMVCAKVIFTLQNYAEEVKLRRQRLKKISSKIRSIFMSHALHEWFEVAQLLSFRKAQAREAAYHSEMVMKRKTWVLWTMYMEVCSDLDTSMKKWAKKQLARSFNAWVNVQVENARQEILVQRNRAKLNHRLLHDFFYVFCSRIIELKEMREEVTQEALQDKLDALSKENERLRIENARYAKFVDTSDLGRGRIKELSQAVNTLQSEGDELKDLVGLLRHDYENISRPDARNRYMAENALQRNKMLVKGGSSFNALIRALKQDLVDSRKPKKPKMRDENILYEVDRLSLDEVC